MFVAGEDNEQVEQLRAEITRRFVWPNDIVSIRSLDDETDNPNDAVHTVMRSICMQRSVSLLLMMVLLVHAFLGCCAHHTDACGRGGADCPETVNASPCGTGAQPHHHVCEGDTCVFVRAANTISPAFLQGEELALGVPVPVVDLCAKVSLSVELDRVSSLREKVQLHILHQILLI